MRYMLDTNTVSDIVKCRPKVLENLKKNASEKLCISTIAHAEIMYGLARKPEAVKLSKATRALLKRVQIIEFDEQTSSDYGGFRREMELSGKNLQPTALLIASHAHSFGAVLVTADKAFERIAGLAVEDWTA